MKFEPQYGADEASWIGSGVRFRAVWEHLGMYLVGVTMAMEMLAIKTALQNGIMKKDHDSKTKTA